MFFTKHDMPEGIMDRDEVCIQWASLEAWQHMHWETKRFGFAKVIELGFDGYEKVLCAAVIVKRQEILNNGYTENENGFLLKE